MSLPRRWRREAPLDPFWALRNITFQLNRGEILGVVGRNGAGKSTLLKILSRIVEPTAGFAEVTGRVGSLLEVGTGFHAELTGRENIFLSGALLGMRRAEIRRRFDEIVAFAGVEEFIDTPCKHYSSGMHARLGFAVAAHLDAEVLLVDEVLAVGDAEFQRRCSDKMGDVRRSGRTIVFVSHNLAAVRQICTRAILLEQGRLAEHGDVSVVLKTYGGNGGDPAAWTRSPEDRRWINDWFVPHTVAAYASSGPAGGALATGDTGISVDVGGTLVRSCPALCIGLILRDQDGMDLFWSYQTDRMPDAELSQYSGPIQLQCTIPGGWLNAGRYQIEVIASLHCQEWLIPPGRGPSVGITIDAPPNPHALRILRRPTPLAPILEWRVSSGFARPDPVQ